MTDRVAEHRKYVRAYRHDNYAMGGLRKAQAERSLESLPVRGSYLDVGCGRGEMVDFAESMGFGPCRGTEVVPKLIDGDRVVRGECHALPFGDDSFDVVTMFDVIEHLLPGDDELACRELARVARQCVLLTANNRKARHRGIKLHVNRRPYEEWDGLFRDWFSGPVEWLSKGHECVSETWRVDL